MTHLEAKLALTQLGPGYYIYRHGHGRYATYDIRRCPPPKTAAQRAAMSKTPQHNRVGIINAIASREYSDPVLRGEWYARWRKWRKKQLYSKRNPDMTNDGHRVDSLWNFMLVALHWLYKTHTTDPLVPNRFSQ